MGENKTKELLLHGDCLDVLKTMEDNSVDSVVTDPPYGLSKEPDINEVLSKWLAGEPYDHGHGGFMGKTWDSFVPHPDIWREVFRVLKPGGHALVFAGTRTQDLMTISLRLAGFEVRDVIEFLYFSGFPKSHNVSKAFDRRAGAEREVIGQKWAERYPNGPGGNSFTVGGEVDGTRTAANTLLTAPATELAHKWDGWGTSLKPSHEPIIVVRKPLIDADTGRKLTVADCVEKYGTGAINIDASRIALGDEEAPSGSGNRNGTGNAYMMKDYISSNGGNITPEKGRFPANCITLDGDAFYSKYFNVASAQEAQPNVTPAELSKKASKKDRNSDWEKNSIQEDVITWESVEMTDELEELNRLRKAILDDITQGTESKEWSTLLFGRSITEEKFRTVIKSTISTELSTTTESKTCDLLTLLLTSDYIPDVIRTIKASGLSLVENAENISRLKQSTTNEKTAYRLGVAHAVLKTLLKIKEKGKHGNVHSTVKPTDLMAWLVRLVTPPNGTVLDPFAGSGSTLVATKREGFGFIGVELTEEYIPIIEARTGVEHIKSETRERQATE